MARFIRRYSDEQIDAFLRAVLIDEHTVAEATRMAADGRLNVAPFALDRQYAYELKKKRQEAFEARNEDALEHATRQALKKAHRANLNALRRLSEDADPTERARLAKAVADTWRSIKGDNKARPRGQGQPKPTNTHTEKPNQTQDTLAQLLASAENSANTSEATPHARDTATVRGVYEEKTETMDEEEGAGQFARA